MIEMRWILRDRVDEVLGQKIFVEERVLQYRYREPDVMQADANDWPWSEWIDVPFGGSRSDSVIQLDGDITCWFRKDAEGRN